MRRIPLVTLRTLPDTPAAALIRAHKRSAVPAGIVARAEEWQAAQLQEPRGCITVYFEGNLYDAENLQTLAERIACAADRLVHRYPTIARARCEARDFAATGLVLIEVTR